MTWWGASERLLTEQVGLKGEFHHPPDGWRTFSPEVCLERSPLTVTGAGFSWPQRREHGHDWKMTRFTPRLIHEETSPARSRDFFHFTEKTCLLVFLQGEKGYSPREELIIFPWIPESPHISAVQPQPVWTNKRSNQQETIKQSLHYWAWMERWYQRWFHPLEVKTSQLWSLKLSWNMRVI